MKRLLLLTVMAAIAVAAIALVGLRSLGGSGGVVSASSGTGVVHVEIDLVKDTGWCNTIDTTASRLADGLEYQVAICLTDSVGGSPAALQVDMVYDTGLNTCENEACTAGTCFDDNPDANLGTTLGTGGVVTVPDLGPDAAWDCNLGDTDGAQPKCDKGGTMGRTYLKCMCSTAGCDALSAGDGTSAPLAVVNLKAMAAGADTLKLENAHIFDVQGSTILDCTSGTDACLDAVMTLTGDATRVPTSTATATALPSTPTSTPWCGGVEQPLCPTSTPTPKAWTKTPTTAPTGTPAPSEPGEPAQPPPPPPPPSGGTMPQVVPPGTGTGSGSVAWTTSLMWTLAGAGALSVFLGGLYLRRARNR